MLRAQLQRDQPRHVVGVGRAAAARGIHVLRELVQLVALRVGNNITLRGAAVGGERDARGAARRGKRRRVRCCAGEEEEGGRAHVCAMPVLRPEGVLNLQSKRQHEDGST